MAKSEVVHVDDAGVPLGKGKTGLDARYIARLATPPTLTYSRASETVPEAQLRAALVAWGFATDSTVA